MDNSQTQENKSVEQLLMNDQYPVYPEQQGDEDYKINPYAPV